MLPNLTASLTAVAALAVVLALVWLAARGARMAWLGPQAGNGRMLRAVDSLALDPRRRLHVVACGERHVLLLTGGSADVVVGWMPDPPARADVAPTGPAPPAADMDPSGGAAADPGRPAGADRASPPRPPSAMPTGTDGNDEGAGP